MSPLLRFSMLGLALLAAAITATPAEAYSHYICVAVRTDTDDSDIGEDYFASPSGLNNVPARYAKMRVTRGASTLVSTHFVGYNGCVEFESPHTTGFTLRMWGEARIPRTDNSGQTNTLRIRYANENIPYWTWNFDSNGVGVKWLFTNQSRRTNLLGLSTFAMQRFSDGLNGKTIEVYDDICGTVPNNSCSPMSTGLVRKVYINPVHNARKFVIGHEIGHAVISHWVDAFYSATNYGINAGSGAACETQQTSHALHSREYQSAAFNEGFAHFASTAIWNNIAQTDAWFYYYKDYYKNGSVTFVNVENGPVGGDTKYLETHCSGSDVGRGVELDWQRALWDYLTNSGTKPTKYEILRQMKNGITGGAWSDNDAYAAIVGGVGAYDGLHGTSFLSRWNQMATWNGIDH